MECRWLFQFSIDLDLDIKEVTSTWRHKRQHGGLNMGQRMTFCVQPCSFAVRLLPFIPSRGTTRVPIRSPASRPLAIAVRVLGQLPLSTPQAPPPPRLPRLPSRSYA